MIPSPPPWRWIPPPSIHFLQLRLNGSSEILRKFCLPPFMFLPFFQPHVFLYASSAAGQIVPPTSSRPFFSEKIRSRFSVTIIVVALAILEFLFSGSSFLFRPCEKMSTCRPGRVSSYWPPPDQLFFQALRIQMKSHAPGLSAPLRLVSSRTNGSLSVIWCVAGVLLPIPSGIHSFPLFFETGRMLTSREYLNSPHYGRSPLSSQSRPPKPSQPQLS